MILEDGRKKMMKDLRIGDRILTLKDGFPSSTTVLGFLDKKTLAIGEYLRIGVQGGQVLSISATHLMFILGDNFMVQDIFAKDIDVGNLVYVLHDNEVELVQVVNITKLNMAGAYVPLTDMGTMLVDEVLVSSYASTSHWLAHSVLAPLRWFPNILLENEQSQKKEGIRTIPRILKDIGKGLNLITKSKVAKQENEEKELLKMGKLVCDSMQPSCLS